MFQCDCCGECCRNLDKSDIYKELVYSERPLLCRIDECYEVFFKEQFSKEEYYKLNYMICKELQNKGE
jgi:hypothetical protein